MPQYELHVTVRGDKATWFEWCANMGYKPLHIVLDHGRHKNQLMYSHTFISSNNELALSNIQHMKAQVQQAFVVKRIKLEAPLSQHVDGEDFAYMESHLKCVLSSRDSIRLPYLVEDHIGVSESISEPFTGIHKMYLTERFHLFTAKEAQRRFARTFELYEPMVESMETEVVLWDSAPSIDAGWMSQGAI